MNGLSVEVDVAGFFEYLEAHVRSLFGESQQAKEMQRELLRQVKRETERATWVRVVGMEKPVSLLAIYQPNTIRVSGQGNTEVGNLLGTDDNAILFAGPGRGKTTFLHWIFLQLLKKKERVPLLFTLRWSGAVENLRTLVAVLAGGERPKKMKGKSFVLLVDGYDEITRPDRRIVSEALQEFSGLGLGRYILSSRTHYQIIELRGRSFYLEDFSPRDAIRFMTSFKKAYGGSFSPRALLEELETHGFSDFVGSPLMLTLACILKTSRMPRLPKNAVGFIRRAVDTLTFRWDEAKGIERETRYPEIDGDDRFRCLMRVAYKMFSLEAPHASVRRFAEEHLGLLGQERLNVDRLLEEIAQWYGLLVPVGDSNWAFVHKTIHDYLAARFWVESGQFDPRAVREWNIRAAYAACLVPDATETVMYAMRHQDGVAAVAEILYNSPPFDRKRVAASVIGYFSEYPDAAYHTTRPNFARVEVRQDFFGEMPEDLVVALLELLAGQRRRRELDIVAGACFSELQLRGRSAEDSLRKGFESTFGEGEFLFSVMRATRTFDFRLGELWLG